MIYFENKPLLMVVFLSMLLMFPVSLQSATLTLLYIHNPSVEVEWRGDDLTAENVENTISSKDEAVMRIANNFEQSYQVFVEYEGEDDGTQIEVESRDASGKTTKSSVGGTLEKVLTLRFPNNRNMNANQSYNTSEIRLRNKGVPTDNPAVVTMTVSAD